MGTGDSALRKSWLNRVVNARGFLRACFFLLPATLFLAFLYLGALFDILIQSFQTYFPGRIVFEPYIFTYQNWIKYFVSTRTYYQFLWTTLSISLESAAIAVVLAYPVAYLIARSRFRKQLLTILVASFFLNSMSRVVAWLYLLSAAGPFGDLLVIFGQNGLLGHVTGVIIGMVSFQVSPAALALIGPIQNVDPALEDAAANLGANPLTTFLTVTFPLSVPGVLAAATLALAVGISSFVIPAFLGLGTIDFMTNIIWRRYGETFNYPAGATLAVALLVVALVFTYGLNMVLTRTVRRAR